MAQAQATLAQTQTRRRRDIAFGIIALLAAAGIIYLAIGTTGQQSTFELTSRRGGVTIAAPDLVLPTTASLIVLGVLAGVAGFWQVFRGFKKGDWVLILIAALAILAFLVWATRGKSLNMTGMMVSSIVRATPIALAALSGIYSERSGVVNIGIEGMMLLGSFTSVVFASLTQNMFVGVIAGILAGVLLGALHGVLSIKYKVNQIISGAGIIILALGLTSYLQRSILNVYPELNQPGPAIAAVPIPGLWRIPVLGPVFFNLSPIIYTLFALLIVSQVLMNYTRWGLRVRSVGEHPKAADTLGINVFRVRYLSVLLSGAIAGLAGAYMSIGAAGRFNEGMSAGKGFLGLAAMIFGNWNPFGAFAGSLIFGFFDSWQEKLSLLQVGIPVDLLGMAPYIATMVVLAGFVGRSRMPAADGIPYEKE
jgi:simple sugar transport system permease protein